VLLAEQAGAVGGSLSCQGATAADTVKADITFTVKANADVTALAKKWGAIKDNFTLTTSTGFGSQVAVRTANYVSYGDGNGLIISKKDGEAYPFNFPSASDQSSVNVLPHDRGVGSEVLAKNAPAFAIGEGDFRAYTALSSALMNKYTYFIVGTPIASMMMNLGMSSTLVSTSSADYYLAFLGIAQMGVQRGDTTLDTGLRLKERRVVDGAGLFIEHIVAGSNEKSPKDRIPMLIKRFFFMMIADLEGQVETKEEVTC
jgi:hypothetical protein